MNGLSLLPIDQFSYEKSIIGLATGATIAKGVTGMRIDGGRAMTIMIMARRSFIGWSDDLGLIGSRRVLRWSAGFFLRLCNETIELGFQSTLDDIVLGLGIKS